MSTDKVYFVVAGTESLFPVRMADIQTGFVHRIQSYFPVNPVEWVSLEKVREGLALKLEEAKAKFPGAAVVTLSSLYFPNAEYEVSANRLVDFDKKKLGLGGRPGSMNLAQQVKNIMADVADRPVITVDDTLFHGETLLLLMELGLRVNAAVEYFTSADALKHFAELGIPIFTAVELDDYLDVMPLHDFLPPLPLCGKVIGKVGETYNEPIVVDVDSSYSIPYLMPWLTATELESWSSIPADKGLDFSKFAIEQSIEVFNRLWAQGLHTIRDAAHYSKLRASVPYLNRSNLKLDAGIAVALTEYLHLLG